jgi:hypothetical protein
MNQYIDQRLSADKKLDIYKEIKTWVKLSVLT